MPLFRALASVLPALLAASAGPGGGALGQSPSSQVFGLWLDPSIGAQVRLVPCGDGLCGDLVRLPAEAPRTDVNNPDPGLRGRPLLGLRIVENFRPAGDGLWDGGGMQGARPGRIYLPANGDTLGDDANTYRIKLTGPDRLSIGIKDCLLTCGMNRIWRRVDGPAADQVSLF